MVSLAASCGQNSFFAQIIRIQRTTKNSFRFFWFVNVYDRWLDQPVFEPRSIFYRQYYQGGRGGSKVDFHLFIDSDRGECQLPGTFFGMKSIVPNQSYHIFKSQKYIKLHCAITLCDSPKINFRIYLLLQFLSYGLETWELCSGDQNKAFDQADFLFRPQKWKYRILKNPNIHFWSTSAYKQLSKFNIVTSEA